MPYSSRFEDALLYAARLHVNQVRKKSGTPYITHLLGVASITAEYGGDEDQVIAALLHDGPEDQGGRETLEEIRKRFGEKVARIVEDCTDTFDQPKPPWLPRKQTYVRHLAKADNASLLVSAADKLHNARTIVADQRRIGDAIFETFNGKKAGTLWYYRAVLRAFEARGRSEIDAELRRVVREMHRLAGKEAQ